MKRFLLKIVFFLLLGLVVDRVLSNILLEYRPIDYKLFLESKIAFFDDIEETDVLIIGDSHVADALDPRTIEKRTDYSAFNLGIYHSSPFENYYITKAALGHLDSKPKIIVLGTNPVMFERPLSKGKYTPIFIPWPESLELNYYSNQGFDAPFFSHLIREKYLFKSVLNELQGKPYQPTREIEDVYNGHSKFYSQIEGSKWTNFHPRKQGKVRKKQIEYFTKTIKLALQNDIALIIVHPPEYNKLMNAKIGSKAFTDFNDTINEIARKYSVKVFNEYTSNTNVCDTSLFQKEDFLNSQHLNYNGSVKFSICFSDFLESEEMINALIQNK